MASKVCEHVGREAPKARDHLEHKEETREPRKKGRRSCKERNVRDTISRKTQSSRGTRTT